MTIFNGNSTKLKSNLDQPPTYEEVMRSKETVLKQKLEIMRNQLETLEGYAQLGFQMHFKRSD